MPERRPDRWRRAGRARRCGPYPWGVDTWSLDRLAATGLPVARHLGAIREAVARARVAVVQAPPGSGKTALIPAAFAIRGAQVACTQPRRVAARAAAAHVARITGTTLGDRVGYRVRGDGAVSANTSLEFCTAGIMTRQLANDPLASAWDVLVLDEVHERSLDTDLALAFAAEALAARDDLSVVVMSATLDTEAVAALFDADTPVVSVDVPTHPLALSYAPPPRGVDPVDARGVTPGFLDHVARVATTEVRRDSGDVLVFVPGAREVDWVAQKVGAAVPDTPVARLHGSLPFAQQQRALSRDSHAPTRVVVATALAESALTIPGVRCVVDSGLARVPHYDHDRGMGGLRTVPVSQAAATQRAGRAAREAPGRAIRCMDEAVWPKLQRYPAPEIAVSDLADTLLTLAAWGAPGGTGIRLLEPLPEGGRARGLQTLRGIGALDEAGAITPFGRDLHAVPTDPRLARALLEGARRVGGAVAGEVVAALALDARSLSDDCAVTLARLRRGEDPLAASWRQQAARLARLAGPGTPELTGADALAWVVALAYPERLARRRGAPTQGQRSVAYGLASGTGASLPATSPLVTHEWLAVAGLTSATGQAAGTSGALIRQAVPIGRADALQAGRHLVTERVETELRDGRAVGERVRALGAIVLGRTLADPDPASLTRALAKAQAGDRICPGPDSLVPWPASARVLRERLRLLHDALGEPWPDVSRETLTRTADTWLAAAWAALLAGRAIPRDAALTGLRGLLPWPEAARLDELAPERLTLPSGRAVSVTYDRSAAVISAKLQECFGWADNPTVADGKVRVIVDLLDPAGRVCAHTGDLTYFWREVYPQVRAEKRGRYPKHPWPQDPWSALPTARTNRRS